MKGVVVLAAYLSSVVVAAQITPGGSAVEPNSLSAGEKSWPLKAQSNPASPSNPPQSAQPAPVGQTTVGKPAVGAGGPTAATPASQSQVDSLQRQVDTIKGDLSKRDSDFAITLGIGSLVINSGVTDYSNNSNILQANYLGRATPQYLLGVSMRTTVPNFDHLGGAAKDCTKNPPDPGTKCELWRRRPWEGFVSLKFAPQSSQTINGYVIGGSYAIAHYLNALVGYALTPVNEPAPGFRVAASQYVAAQQKLGLDLNFDPQAMLENKQNAFDGFPVTDASGTLIYRGNALDTHYRGGAVFGVSIPFTFSSVFAGKSQ